MVAGWLGQHYRVGRAQGELKLKDGDYPAGTTWCVRPALQNMRWTLLTRTLSERWQRALRRRFWEFPAHYHLQEFPAKVTCFGRFAPVN